MIRLDRIWEQQNRRRALLASAGALLVIASVDWWTPPYVCLSWLYLFPIMLAAGFLPRWALVLLCLGCAVLAEAFGLPDRSLVRFGFEALGLAGCGLFVAELGRNRRLTVETQERLRAIVNSSPAAIITVDECGVVDLANRAADELMIPQKGHLFGQQIDSFVPGLQHALRQEATQFRTSMQCQARRGDGECFVADVWFSTYYERANRKLAAIIAAGSEEHSSAIRSDAEPPDVERPGLNSREMAILRLVFEGLTNREIASRLEMTGSAVKNTLERLFRKTGVNSRSQLVRVALERYRDVL